MPNEKDTQNTKDIKNNLQSADEFDNRWPYSEEEDVGDNDENETGEELSANYENNTLRISFIEGFFLISINLISDILEIFDLTGVGVMIGIIVDFIAGPVTVAWLWFRGISMVSRNAVAQMVELIPIIDILPIRTTAIIFTIITTNHPEWIEKMGLAGDITKKIIEMQKKTKV